MSVMASLPVPPSAQQPPSAFASVESALLSLSGDGGIFNRCLKYFDTPTIVMSLLDGGAGNADADADEEEDGAAAGAAGPIWSHVVSFMDGFTLGALDMTCRDAYRADGWKTAERWVEWDQQLFRDAKAVEGLSFEEALARSTAVRAAVYCEVRYTLVFRSSRMDLGQGRPLPGTFERDGRSRFRVLKCAGQHLTMLYRFDMDPRLIRRDNVADYTDLCGCSISAVIGNRCGWRKIPVRVWRFPEGAPGFERQRVSNLR